MTERLRARHPGSTLVGILFFDCCRQLLKLKFRVLYRTRVHGLRNIPDTGPVLLIANHQSYFDPPLIGCWIGRRQVDFLARGNLFKFKPFAWLISTLHATPIKQGAGDTGAMKEVLKRLSEGRAMLIFPEGSRTPDGSLQEFQRGTAVLLKRAHCTIIPVAVAGVFDVWPRTRKLPKFFAKNMSVVYGDPIASDELMRDGPDIAMQTLRERVQELLHEAESLR